jgi:hypothetical protein
MFAILCQLLVHLALAGESPAFDVQTLDDRALTGALAELSAERLTVDTAQGPVCVEIAKLLDVSLKQKPASRTPAAGVWIELTDGSTIAASQYEVRGDQARITLLSGEALSASTRAVRNVRLQAESQPAAGQWSRILAKRPDSDLLVVVSGENLDYHQGTLGDVSAEAVKFQLDGENLPVKRSKVYGFAYRHAAGDALPAPVCRLSDMFGSNWQVSRIALDGKLHVTTPAGVTVSCSLETVARIDFSLGKIVFLSDLKPELAAWTPFFGTDRTLPSLEQFFAPREDRNFESNPLQLAGKQYAKGLAIHSRTEVVYRLPGSFSRLRAVAGIDDSVRPQGSVRLEVRGDNNVLFEAAISGKDPPTTIDIDLSGVRRLSILVDFGERAGIGDHLDLCNARITK